MAWTYDKATRRYTNDAGDVLDDAAMVGLRDAFADDIGERAKDLYERYHRGQLTLTQWAEAFRALIEESMWASYLLGRGGINAVVAADIARIARAIDEQFAFAAGFARDVALGAITEAQALNRAAMYAGATITAYEQGMAASAGLALPTYPGQGSECLSACRCHWSIEETAMEYLATWITMSDSGVCATCRGRGERWNPYVQPKTVADQARAAD